jgi:hypothetical protein
VGLLRQACAEALACGDRVVHARSLLALGSALVHAVRGRDEEGSLFLHEAVAAAEAAGDREPWSARCASSRTRTSRPAAGPRSSSGWRAPTDWRTGTSSTPPSSPCRE